MDTNGSMDADHSPGKTWHIQDMKEMLVLALSKSKLSEVEKQKGLIKLKNKEISWNEFHILLHGSPDKISEAGGSQDKAVIAGKVNVSRCLDEQINSNQSSSRNSHSQVSCSNDSTSNWSVTQIPTNNQANSSDSKMINIKHSDSNVEVTKSQTSYLNGQSNLYIENTKNNSRGRGRPRKSSCQTRGQPKELSHSVQFGHSNQLKSKTSLTPENVDEQTSSSKSQKTMNKHQMHGMTEQCTDNTAGQDYRVRFLDDNMIEHVSLHELYKNAEEFIKKNDARVGMECFAIYSGDQLLYKAVIEDVASDLHDVDNVVQAINVVVDQTENQANIHGNVVKKLGKYKCCPKCGKHIELNKFKSIFKQCGNVYQCIQCKRSSFTSRQHLVRHALTMHTDSKDYKCPGCQKTFARKDKLTKHFGHCRQSTKALNLESSSGVVQQFELKCCPKCCNFVKLDKPPADPKSYQCTHCEKIFRDTGHLNRHVLSVHTKKKDIGCTACSMVFVRKDSMIKHYRRKHAGDCK